MAKNRRSPYDNFRNNSLLRTHLPGDAILPHRLRWQLSFQGIALDSASSRSLRHNSGANLTFAESHVADYKYSYICSNAVTKPVDPGVFDINWTYNRQRVP
jgi:hypothetical protein